MFKSCGLGGQWIDTRNGHSFSDRTFTQGLKIIGNKPHAFVFCALVPSLCPSRQSQLHVSSMMTSLLPPKRYMVTIALRAPGCSQPSRHRWHASRPSWVGLRTERESSHPSWVGLRTERVGTGGMPPTHHRWHASHPSWVGLRTERRETVHQTPLG